jgi:hypothetical protein
MAEGIMINWLGWEFGSWLGWATSTPSPIPPEPAPVTIMRATSERYVSRQSRYNIYIEDDIDLEDALLLWWKLLNEE